MTDAQQAEASGKNVLAVEYDGATYNVDLTAMTWDALKLDAAGAYASVVELALGPDEFARFTAKHPNPLVLDAAGNLTSIATDMRNAIIAALGNLAASSGS